MAVSSLMWGLANKVIQSIVLRATFFDLWLVSDLVVYWLMSDSRGLAIKER